MGNVISATDEAFPRVGGVYSGTDEACTKVGRGIAAAEKAFPTGEGTKCGDVAKDVGRE